MPVGGIFPQDRPLFPGLAEHIASGIAARHEAQRRQEEQERLIRAQQQATAIQNQRTDEAAHGGLEALLPHLAQQLPEVFGKYLPTPGTPTVAGSEDFSSQPGAPPTPGQPLTRDTARGLAPIGAKVLETGLAIKEKGEVARGVAGESARIKAQEAAQARREQGQAFSAELGELEKLGDLPPKVQGMLGAMRRAYEANPAGYDSAAAREKIKPLYQRLLITPMDQQGFDTEKPGEFRPEATHKLDVRVDEKTGTVVWHPRPKNDSDRKMDTERIYYEMAKKYPGIDVYDPQAVSASIQDPRDRDLLLRAHNWSRLNPTMVAPQGTVTPRGFALPDVGQGLSSSVSPGLSATAATTRPSQAETRLSDPEIEKVTAARDMSVRLRTLATRIEALAPDVRTRASLAWRQALQNIPGVKAYQFVPPEAQQAISQLQAAEVEWERAMGGVRMAGSPIMFQRMAAAFGGRDISSAAVPSALRGLAEDMDTHLATFTRTAREQGRRMPGAPADSKAPTTLPFGSRWETGPDGKLRKIQ